MQAFLIIERPIRKRTVEQVAAWYTEVELAPGEYPVEARGPLPYFRSARVPGVVTAAHFPSMFGGVSYGANPRDAEMIGRPACFPFHVPDSCEDRPEAVERFNASQEGARLEIRG